MSVATKRRRERYWVHSAPDEIGDDLKPCARGVWCLERSVEIAEGQQVITPALTPRAFCEADRTDIAAKLKDLPFLSVALTLALRTPAKGTVLIRVPFGPRLPIRVDVDALLRLTVEVTASWHARVAQVARLTHVDVGYARSVALAQGPVLVDRSSKVLAGHLTTLFGLPAERMPRPAPIVPVLPGAELPDTITTTGVFEWHDLDGAWAGNELVRLHHLASAAVGVNEPKPERLPGVPCRQRRCDAFTLRRAPMPQRPEDTVYWSECYVCGDMMTEPEYRQWTKRYAIYASTGEFPVE